MEQRQLPKRADTHCGICGRAFTTKEPYGTSLRGAKYHHVCANGASHYMVDVLEVNLQPAPPFMSRPMFWPALDPLRRRSYRDMVAMAPTTEERLAEAGRALTPSTPSNTKPESPSA